jgi:uncharacterized protein (TIGR02646 family)
MKHIDKKESPENFENWKEKYKSGSEKNLEERYKTDISGNDLWEVLPSSSIKEDRKEEGIIYYSKQELRSSIIVEQGFICCYCNQEVKNDNTSVLEHFNPKGLKQYKNQTFDYKNILISCNGGQKDPKPKYSHCDTNRKKGEELPLSPLQTDIEEHFDFTIDGQIIGKTDAGNEIIGKLGLDIFKLEDLRESAIRAIVYENPFDQILEFRSKEDALREKKRLQQLENKRFEPFCTAIIKVLDNEIINIL